MTMENYMIDPAITTSAIPDTHSIATEVKRVCERLGIDLSVYGFQENDPAVAVGTNDGRVALRTPITGESYASVAATTSAQTDAAIGSAAKYFTQFRSIPAPKRGEFVRVLGNLLREYKHEIGFLVSVEAGKIISEGLGEVQEMIDIADLAVGQSRQLFGKTIASERPSHSMRETYHPLGVVGVVTAFNFPVAVWAWNSCLAFICGDPVVFKPSDKTCVSAVAIHELARRAARESGIDEKVSQLVLGGVDAAVALANNKDIALLSVTGSTVAGAALAPLVQARFGKTLLELGGNNAMIVTPSADLNLAVRAITFSAAGTAGQRCTTLRRVIAHKDVIDELTSRVAKAYASLNVGNPLCPDTLVGPLIEERSSVALGVAVKEASGSGTVVASPERELVNSASNAFYHRPGLTSLTSHIGLLQRETFAPLLNCVTYTNFDDALSMNNSVPQGLSSAIFTNDVREAEKFLAESDCGIANVNIGPSGAEIGGAFGGEKHTGGGRESGSDAWKAYMRRATNTVNYGDTLPLAQGVEFS